MLKNRVQFFILLIIVLVLYIMTNTYFALVLLLFFLAFPAFALLFLMLSFAKVNVDFNIPSIIKKSEKAEIEFTVSNTSIFPISGVVIYIICRNNLRGEEVKSRRFCNVNIKGNNTVSFYITDTSSGQITINLYKFKICDIFGLFCFSKNCDLVKGGIIYPDTYNVEITMENPTEIIGDGERYSQTKKGQDVNEIFALREYTSGDEIRKIHWKLSAKHNKVIVREFGLPLNYPVFLLLDVFNDKSVNSGEVLDACMETFVSLSESLIESGICHNIAWYDSAREKLMVKEISSRDHLEAYLPNLLSIQSYDTGAVALRFYEESNYHNNQLILLYITTIVSLDKLAKRSVSQTVRTIYITDKDDENIEGINLTRVSPKNIEKDIGKITI